MTMQIEKRNNKCYLVYSDVDYSEPRIISSFWQIKNIDADLLEKGQYLEKFNGVYITKISDKIIPLYTEKFPTFTEFTPLNPPKKTGYKWNSGKWIKI